MGSLMSGWDSPVLKSKPDFRTRNQSLTKDDIEAYWRSNQGKNAGHLKRVIQKMNGGDESGRKFEKSSSMPLTRTKEDMETTEPADTCMNKNGWWAVSNWAFLNGPPTLTDGASSNTSYPSQFHVSRNWAPKSNAHDQIST